MRFCKMNGAGNDFIIINNREERLSHDLFPAIAKVLCHRRLSIGADGLMVVEEPSQGGDYRMRRRLRRGDVRQRRPVHLPLRL